MLVLSRYLSVGVIVATVMGVSSCDFETEPTKSPQFRPASTPVINEVFALPITHPSWYCWVEFLNPTRDTVNLNGWTVSYNCLRFNQNLIVLYEIDSSSVIRTELDDFTVPDSQALYDVPFSEGNLKLAPNGLFTLVSSEDRLLDHTHWGPGDQRFALQVYQLFGGLPAIRGSAERIDTLFADTNRVYPDTVLTIEGSSIYAFIIPQTEQLVLKDPTGRVVDVVRYGNYQYSGPAPDPYAGNQSLGIIPEFESFARFAGGYYTGNTANDFYVSSSDVRPIPHWYNQLYKP